MKKLNVVLAVGILLLALPACSSGSDDSGSSVDSESSGVPWQDYDPTLQSRIDQLGAARDCTSLQQQFDNADANSEATRSRTGHSNSDLMAYIDSAMQKAGCYK